MWGLVARITMWLEGWNFQSNPWSLREEELEVESVTSDQWFNQSWVCNEVFIKTLKDRIWKLPGGWTHGELRKVLHWERAWHLHALPRMHLFHLAAPDVQPFIINRWSSKCPVSCSGKLIKATVGSLEPASCSQSAWSRCDSPGLWLASEVEEDLVGCGIWCPLQADSVRVELTCRTPSWCLRDVCWWGETPTACWHWVSRILLCE